MRVACLVFAKPPVPGRAKTRLAVEVGEQRAARIAAALLADTLAAVRQVEGLHVVLATPEPDADHGVEIEAWDQGRGDLGARLERTLRRALRDHDAALAIGADAPHVPVARYREAMRHLELGRAVLGPTDDGGFYLLGLRRCPEGLLAGLPWSTPETAAATEARLGDVARLEACWDVDRPDDLRRFRAEVPVAVAPRTHAEIGP